MKDILNILQKDAKIIENNLVIYPKLYKRNAQGKVLIWYLEREEYKYRTISGQLEGKKTTSNWTIAKEKNIGKINSTTAEQQAEKECLAKYEKKLAQGSYSIKLEEAKEFNFIKPMLAEPYYSETVDPETGDITIKNNIPDFTKDSYYIQSKIDGIRTIATKDGLFSRQGKVIIGVPHINEALITFFKENPDIILDGELYNHSLSFEDIVSCVRSEVLVQDKKEDLRLSIKYYLYDIVDTTLSYKERLTKLNTLNINSGYINILFAKEVNNEQEVKEQHDSFVKAGYEGAILRKGSGLYIQRRTKNLLKVKEFVDAEFPIVEVLEGKGNNANIAAKIGIRLPSNLIVYPNMTGSWAFCKKVLKEKEEYIEGVATVKYFGYTEEGSLRFPSIKYLFKNKRDL